MKKKKEKCSKLNYYSAIIFFVVATALRVFEIELWGIYVFAGIFWINWQFDKTNWLILDIARIFVDSMKSPEERSGE